MTDQVARVEAPFVVDFSHAMQPVVDLEQRTVYAYEALVRGPNGESAGSVFAQIGDDELALFDQQSRIRAVALAGRLSVACYLSLNALPRSVTTRSSALDELIEACTAASIEPSRVVLELTENEAVADRVAFESAVDEYRGAGFRLAIDDFGAGYSGLNLLADFQPDIVKLDMNLVRDIESHGPRQSIVRAIVTVCEDLGIDVIAEGVETRGEADWLRGAGITLFQGYLFAKPGFQRLPRPEFSG